MKHLSARGRKRKKFSASLMTVIQHYKALLFQHVYTLDSTIALSLYQKEYYSTGYKSIVCNVQMMLKKAMNSFSTGQCIHYSFFCCFFIKLFFVVSLFLFVLFFPLYFCS